MLFMNCFSMDILVKHPRLYYSDQSCFTTETLLMATLYSKHCLRASSADGHAFSCASVAISRPFVKLSACSCTHALELGA